MDEEEVFNFIAATMSVIIEDVVDGAVSIMDTCDI